MSGAEFVAVLSIGASVIAVVDACNKLRNRIKEFEDDETLRELAAQLRLFANGIEILRQQSTDEDLDTLTQDALIEVLDCCEKQINELDVLITSALPVQKNNGVQRIKAAMRNLRDNKRVGYILNSLQRCQQLLVFHMASVSRRRQLYQAQDQQGASSILSAHEPSHASSLNDVQKARSRQRPPPIPAQSCVRGTCGCACHRMTMRLLGVVSFNFPFPFLSKCTCVDTTIGVSFFALHRILTFNLSVAWMDGITIGTSLKFVNTVPYSSPGLAVLAKFSAGAIGSAETIETLSTLRKNNLLDIKEATINNEGYLERLLPTTSHHPERIRPTVDVIQYLTEQGVQWRSSRPIAVCLESIYDVTWSQASVMDFLGSMPPFELSEGHLSDFLFVVFMNNRYNHMPICLQIAFDISKCDNIYGRTTDLHDTVMTGSLDEVMALVEGKPGLHHGTTNILGHSALHFAIERPQILAYLLHNGFAAEIEVGDRLGMTPLMYAAASKQLTSAKLLLEHGADPWRTHTIWATDRDSFFWADLYARNHQDPSAFIELLDHYLASVSLHQAQKTVDHCLERLINTINFNTSEEKNRAASEVLMYLLRLGANVNQIDSNGNTFLHSVGNTWLDSVESADMARFLLNQPITMVSHQNVHGYTALMIWVKFDDAHLIRALLHAGADAKMKDKRNMSALHHVLEQIMRNTYSVNRAYHYCFWGEADYSSSSFKWEDWGSEFMNAIASSVLLTRAGASLLDGDSCTCYCSTQGCTPLHKFFRSMEKGGGKREMLLYQLPWLLEFSLVMEACGFPGVINNAVRILVRQRHFEELQMTHTCCNENLCSHGHYCGHEFCFTHSHCRVAELPIVPEEVAETQTRETELNKQLESRVRDSEVLNPLLTESQLISQLADWAVELEARPIEYMKTRSMLEYQRGKEKTQSRRRQTTLISHDPVVYVDNSSGEIICLREPHPLKTWTASDFINVYLEDLRKHPDYLDDFTDIAVDSNALALRREALAKQLMEEIDRLRIR